jgi:hypothetical protein
VSTANDFPDGWFQHPEAAVVWAGIQALPEALKHDLLPRLQEHLARPDERDTPHAARVAQAISAVREAQQIHFATTGDERVSSYAYDQLQRESEIHDWPPIATVRRHLGAGSWSDVLRICHLPQPSRYAFYSRRGDWGGALADAGLELTGWESSLLGRGHRPMSVDVLLSTFREAFQAKGDPFTKDAYTNGARSRYTGTLPAVCRRAARRLGAAARWSPPRAGPPLDRDAAGYDAHLHARRRARGQSPLRARAGSSPAVALLSALATRSAEPRDRRCVRTAAAAQLRRDPALLPHLAPRTAHHSGHRA